MSDIRPLIDAMRAMLGPPPVIFEPPNLTDDELANLKAAFERLYHGPLGETVTICVGDKEPVSLKFIPANPEAIPKAIRD